MPPVKKREVVFLSGARTPFGTYGGTLKNCTATELATVAAKGALARSGISPEDIGHVVFGNVMQTSADAPYLARHVGLNAGVPISTPALTVNRGRAASFRSPMRVANEAPKMGGVANQIWSRSPGRSPIAWM